MMGVDLGLGRGHHNVICGEQRLYQHIMLLLTHSSNIIQSLEMSSKSEPFSETLLELFYISAGLLRPASQLNEHCSLSKLLQYCLQMIDVEGCAEATTAQKFRFFRKWKVQGVDRFSRHRKNIFSFSSDWFGMSTLKVAES